MAWTVPEHSKSEVIAGKLLASDDATGNTRPSFVCDQQLAASHSFPLNTFQVSLHGKARRMTNTPCGAAHKAHDSIELKLERFPTRSSQMQDMADVAPCSEIIPKFANYSVPISKQLSAKALRATITLPSQSIWYREST